MVARVQKWGNSLALRIPSSYARDARLTAGASVDLNLRQGTLVIRPKPEKKPTLAELLKGVSKRNLHGEVMTGAAVGREFR
jgi:antitoxin MazE